MTVLNPAYYPWLLAVGLPVVIHLLTRQAVRVYSLPTFRFLERSVARQSKLFRVRHLLLLVLRALLIALLVFLFLKPVGKAPLAASAKGRTVMVVLDCSLSMSYRAAGVSSFQRAQAQALKALDSLQAGDSANVLLVGAAPAAALSQPSPDLATLRSAVRSAVPTEERCDVNAATALAAEQLAKTDAGSKEIVFVSDFQRSNWADVKIESLPAGVQVVFVGTDDGDRTNTAVTGIRLRPSAPRAGDEVSAIVEVWNGTDSPRPIPVTFRIEGGASQTQTVQTPPHASATAAFPASFPQPGRYRCSASVPEDSLPGDNQRWLLADLQHSMTVYLLTDENAAASSAGSYFVSRALNPAPEQAGGIRVLPRHASQMTDADFRAADAVILSNVVTMPADRLPALLHYVQAGGALLVFLYGDRVIPQMEALNRLAGKGEGLPFLPSQPMDVSRMGKGYVTLSEARYESRLLRVFKDPSAADLGTIRFYRFFLTSEPDGRSEVLLKFDDGTPAAARRALGTGNVLLCNFSPSPKDADLVKQEVFPPLLHELLKGLASKEGERREFVPGAAASTTITPPKGSVTVTGPDGRGRAVTVDRPSGGVVLERADRAGFYTVLADNREAAVMAVNIHPDESDLRTIDPRELQSQQSRRPAYFVSASGGQLEDLSKPRPIWPYILVAALAALLLEQWVAGLGKSGREEAKAA